MNETNDYISKVVLNDLKHLYNYIKDVETINPLILKYREELKKKIQF